MPSRFLELANQRQKEESDCLAACAVMMLDTCGIVVPYRKLLSILDVATWGTPHRNICKLVEIVPHIRVIYKQGELVDLYRTLDAGLPPTAFVWTAELPYWTVETWHSVVLVGYDAQKFYINDPAFDVAPQSVSQGDFDLAWLAYDSYYAVVEPV